MMSTRTKNSVKMSVLLRCGHTVMVPVFHPVNSGMHAKTLRCGKCRTLSEVESREELWVIVCSHRGCGYATVTNRLATVTAETRAARHMVKFRHVVVRASSGPDGSEIVHRPTQGVTLPLGDKPPF